MGSKKGKDSMADDYWRTSIENAPLNDDNWRVQVVIIEAAGSDQDRIYLNKFEIFAAYEKRFVVKNICKTETIFMVNQLGGEKKVKDESLRVFEEGQSYLKDKKDIPPEIQALIIKHLILKIKQEYLFIKRQRLEVKKGMQTESTTMVNRDEVRGTVNFIPPEPVVPHPKGKKDKKESEEEVHPEPELGKKYNTLLRVRGEEWRDKVYVDDFPTEGPNLYVSITGFVEPHLPGCLVKIGVPLTGIVQIRINPTAVKVPSSLFKPTKRGQSQTELLTEKSLSFWEDLQQMRINSEYLYDFKRIAFIVFSPPYRDTDSLSGSPDNIYNELCYLMYDIQDLTRQHSHYIDNMDIIRIPEGSGDGHYQKYYRQLIDDLPLESVTVYSVMDSIMQTVCKSELVNEKTSRSSLSMAMKMNEVPKNLDDNFKLEKAENLVKEIFNTLCVSDANRRSYRITYGAEYESHIDPKIINYGDFAKMPTFHLENINLNNIIWSSLYCMPIHNLWKNQERPTEEVEAKINFHVNVLLTCFDRVDVEMSELNRLIHILACRKLYENRSSLKKKHKPSSTLSDFKKIFMKRTVLAEPLAKCPSVYRSSSTISPSFPLMTKSENISSFSCIDDPEIRRMKFLFNCHDIGELVSATEIANARPLNHMIDDFDFFEDFKEITTFQIMLDAFNRFNCVDYKYCEVTDCMILMFFNSHDTEGIAREEWRCHIPTPLCLQDFFDFVLDEHYDWIQNEEKIYDENINLKSQSDGKDQFDIKAVHSCIENTEVETELLIEGSLKYQELANLEDSSQGASDEKSQVTSGKKTTVTASTTEVDKSSRKSKSLASTIKSKFLSNTVVSQESVIIPKKPFSGYDLGDRRVEVFGKDAIYYSQDGTKVSSFYTLLIPMNLEYIILNVVPGNGQNEFWFHRALGDQVISDILDTCESFRISTKDQLYINIKKQNYQVPLPLANISSIKNMKRKESFDSPTEKVSDYVQGFETKSFHSLIITWPNGLIIESVYEINCPVISHIKLFYLNYIPHLDEEMRCISLNGDVIIFRPTGKIEVLRPDGTFIKITSYAKKIVVPEVHISSETSSEKSKKGKGKDKPKEKSRKTSSKTSKNVFAYPDKLSDVFPIEYELVVDEFECIETSGLRQKWINDVPFDIEKLLIRTATDYCIREVFSRRMDGTNILLNRDGVLIVTFPDQTRIITNYIIEDEEIYPEWTEEEKEYFVSFGSDTIGMDQKSKTCNLSQTHCASDASNISKKLEEEQVEKDEHRMDGYLSIQIIYIIEHANFATVTVNKSSKDIKIDSPNDTSVTVDTHNNYIITLDNATSAKFNGEHLVINYEACPECKTNTTCTVKVKSEDKSNVADIHQSWLQMEDSFDKKIFVSEDGSITRVNEDIETKSTEITQSDEKGGGNFSNSADKQSTSDSKSSVATSHGKCKEMCMAKKVKFFVLHRDLTCAELVHRSLLDEYNGEFRNEPWCFINRYDTFGDHRNLLSILAPIHLNEAEKWLMDSKLADKPKYLTYKDLKKDSGKGFYHWMRPYKRFQSEPKKPENVLPPRLPRAFVLRTLEQQWNKEKREQLKGAKELVSAILRYRMIMESDYETILRVPLRDMRNEDERRIDEIIQALAHRIYEDLKIRLANDVETRAKPTITTKPSLRRVEEDMSVEMVMEEEMTGELEALEEDQESVIKDLETAGEMSDNLKKYWRRRAEELKEEEFYKYLLREHSVPPYFRNVLGGAIWWEMNNAAGEAATKAEKKKMKCVCGSGEGTSRTEDSSQHFI